MPNVPQDTIPDDLVLLETFLAPIRKCTEYVPAFGSGAAGGLTLSGFRDLYGTDSFYSWIGLDDPLEHFKVEMQYIRTKKTTRRHPAG